MSDNHDYLRTSDRTFRMRADGLALMLKGAGYALVFCLVLLLFAGILMVISNALPDASKEADDPTPVSALHDPQDRTLT